MIVPDTSIWIELLRGTGSREHRVLQRLIASGQALAITETILMEVLAGVVTRRDEIAVRARLLALPLLTLEGLADFEEAAAIFRTCRDAGESLRGTIDCLIAVPVIRADASIFHRDRDFDTIARHTGLRIHR